MRAVQSAYDQTVPVEIVVVDDCSTDATYDLVHDFSQHNERVTVLRHTQNQGPAAARNLAIQNSTAPWIAVLDADDHMASDRIETLVRKAEADDVDFLADDIYRVSDTDLSAKDRRLWSQTDIGDLDLTFAEFVEGNRRKRYGQRGELGFVKPLMRRSFLDSNTLNYASDLRLAEDYLLYAKALALGGRFRLTDPHGYFAVFRSDSLSSKHTTADLGAIVAADKALSSFPNLKPQDQSALRRHRLDVQKEWAWRRLIDAVHARDIQEIGSLILEPPSVSAYVLSKCLEQCWLRGPARLLKSS